MTNGDEQKSKTTPQLVSGSHRAVVADVEEVLLPLCSGGHVTPLHAAPDPVRGVPHELRVVPDLVQVVRAPVEPVLQWSQDVFQVFIIHQILNSAQNTVPGTDLSRATKSQSRTT